VTGRMSRLEKEDSAGDRCSSIVQNMGRAQMIKKLEEESAKGARIWNLKGGDH